MAPKSGVGAGQGGAGQVWRQRRSVKVLPALSSRVFKRQEKMLAAAVIKTGWLETWLIEKRR
jgi:hypothetical protein